MHEWQSVSHVKWECKYHVVITPKYRRKVFFRKDAEAGWPDPEGTVPATKR